MAKPSLQRHFFLTSLRTHAKKPLLQLVRRTAGALKAGNWIRDIQLQ